LWLHSLKVAQLLRSAACLHTNQSRSYLNHLLVPLDMSHHTLANCQTVMKPQLNPEQTMEYCAFRPIDFIIVTLKTLAVDISLPVHFAYPPILLLHEGLSKTLAASSNQLPALWSR